MPVDHKLDIIIYVYNLITLEIETETSEVKSYLGLHTEFEAFGYKKSFLNSNISNNNNNPKKQAIRKMSFNKVNDQVWAI